MISLQNYRVFTIMQSNKGIRLPNVVWYLRNMLYVLRTKKVNLVKKLSG